MDFLRRHAFAVAVAVLVWYGWSPSASPVEDDSSLVEDEVTGPTILPIEGWEPSPVGDAEPGSDPFRLAEVLAERLAERAPDPSGEDAYGGLAETPAPRGAALVLQATYPGFPTPAATLNGHDVAVGEAVPGVSDSSPPVLLDVVGTSATLSWRGERIVLDLDGNPEHRAAAAPRLGGESGGEPAPKGDENEDQA